MIAITGMRCILIVAFSFMAAACEKKTATTEKAPQAIRPDIRERISSDTCSFCVIDSMYVDPCNQYFTPQVTIDYPVAIEFFNMVRFIYKYDHAGGYDTLVTVLGTRGRGMIYDLSEQHAYYAEGIKPVLVKSGVVIDSLNTMDFIKINDAGKSYSIDLRKYQRKDGVLMFTPGKRPIFWTMKRDEEYCYGYFGFAQWYYNCH